MGERDQIKGRVESAKNQICFAAGRLVAGIVLLSCFGAAPAWASQCNDLPGALALEFDDGAALVQPVTVQDVGSGSYTPAGSDAPIPGLPPFCRVALDISSTGDASKSQILVEIWLPESGWNGRYLGTGNGAFAGTISVPALAAGLAEGYAVANTDMGTGVLYQCNTLYCGGRIGRGGPPGGLNGHPDSIRDFGYRATHLMTVAAKQVVAAYYGKPQHHAYFAGCSTGGQQSLMEAQRFPDDYDGILAGAPAYDRTHLHMIGSWAYAWTHASTSSLLTVPALSLINHGVLEKCGGHDGGLAGEGFLTQPAACRFDARILQCTGAATDVPCTAPDATSCTCLASEQAAAMEAIWHGPVDTHGRQLQPGFLRSSETPVPLSAANPYGNLGLVWGQAATEPPLDSLMYWALGPDWKWQDFFADAADPVAMLASEIRAIDTVPVGETALGDTALGSAALGSMALGGTTLSSTALSSTALSSTALSSTALSSTAQGGAALGGAALGEISFADALNATSVDLSRFRENGSKLILYQGWSDPLIPGYVAVDYWRALRRAEGHALADYARLFMAPGMWHCSGGPGPNAFGGQNQVAPPKPGDPSDDALAALANWVENGFAPTEILATKYVGDVPANGIALQRPLCEYPRHAAYRGSGSPSDPASFECVRGRGDRIVAPAAVYGP